MLLFSLSIFLILFSTPMCVAESVDNTPISEFDLQRYMGKWYEIARFDNRYERNLSEVTALYSLDDEENVVILNRGFNTHDLEWREAHGKGEPTTNGGQLRVSFFLFFSTDYNIMALGDDYEWALVGSKSHKYLWILSRTPSLDDETLNHIIEIAHKRGYNVEELSLIEHSDLVV